VFIQVFCQVGQQWRWGDILEQELRKIKLKTISDSRFRGSVHRHHFWPRKVH